MKFLLLGTFDTKKDELLYIDKQLKKYGEVVKFDIGVFNILDKSEGYNYKDLIKKTKYSEINLSMVDKDESMKIIFDLLPDFTFKLYEHEKFDGIISIGGGCGTTLAGRAFKKLPFGLPKVLVSTVISSVKGYDFYGSTDVCLFPSILDISGLNDISISIFNRSVNSLIGMCKFNDSKKESKHKIHIGITMFGVTQKCVDNIKNILKNDSELEIYVFHATGSGGNTMEDMAKNGEIDYIIDLTTTEITDFLFGGILSSNKYRLTANIPRIISLGASEMIYFGKLESVPKKYDNYNKYKFNENTTLIRINKNQSEVLGCFISRKVNKLIKDNNDIELIIPKKGFSQLDSYGNDFFNENIDDYLIKTINKNVNSLYIKEFNFNINEKSFAKEVVNEFYKMKNRRIN